MGSTHTLLRRSDSTMLTDIHTNTLSVQLPNGARIHSHSVGSMHLPNLDKALDAYVFEDDELSLSLLSISDLCNAGCTVTFTADHIAIFNNGSMILQDSKDKRDSLWHVKLPIMTAQANASTNTYTPVPTKSSKDVDFVKFIHAAFGSPSLSIFTDAIRANFIPSLTRLTCTILATNPPHTIPTVLGHLDQVRQGQNSTKRFVS